MKFYVVSIMLNWSDLQIDTNLKVESKVSMDKMPGIGFMPVFKSKKEAQKAYPGQEVFTIVKENA